LSKSAENRWLAIAAYTLALGSCLPVLLARYPQMSDYPAHLARYAVMLDAGHSADLARYYTFQWSWTGNLGVDILIRPFAAIFGLETGGRIIAGLIPPLTGLGIIATDIALRRRITLASLLAMPFVWSPMMLIGLINFALGQAAALWAFALWVRNPRGRGLAFIPIGLLVWLCHISAWGVLGVMILAYELAQSRPIWPAFLRPWPLLGPLVVMKLIPGTASSFSYGPYVWLYKQAIWQKATRDTLFSLDTATLIATILLIALALLRRRIDPRLGLAGGLLLVLSIAVPRHISGGDYADYRLITAGLMVCGLALTFPAPRWATVLAGAHVALRLALTTHSWQADSATTARLLTALDHLPQGARLASAVVVDRSQWPLNHFEHIGAYAVIRKHALVNANFAVPHVHMLGIKTVPSGFVDPSQRLLVLGAQPIDLAHFRPAAYADYLWYVADRAPTTTPPGTILWRDGHSFLLALPTAPLANSRKGD
jgi:hypothetical protein